MVIALLLTLQTSQEADFYPAVGIETPANVVLEVGGITTYGEGSVLENAYYSVISPEGCAAILWKEANPQTNSIARQSTVILV